MNMTTYEVLKEYFGYHSFRVGQEGLIHGILEGEDVLGIMPTSGGKSLCYQIPSLLMKGTTLVISPLISLMKDQVDTLTEIGIPAAYINSTLSDQEIKIILNNIQDGKYRLVYVAPERLKSYDFFHLASHIELPFIAVDEAHCISQWGHDFRPSYKEIPKFIKNLNHRPVVAAFTATATPEIIEDIKHLLHLQSPKEIITSFDRPNLFFQVEREVDKKTFVIDYIKKHKDQSGIIYCSTRKEVEGLGTLLQNKGYGASIYHGGMTKEERERAQESFLYDETSIMVATNAFGMGIDKSNVRFVLHYNIPQSMEAYYQEAGRAGRDGEKSDCILLFSPQDVIKQKFLIQESQPDPDRATASYKNLQYLVDYCYTHHCLRHKILDYFGQSELQENCNNCSSCLEDKKLKEITIEAQKILSCVYRMKQQYGSTLVAQVLKGSKNKKLLNFGLNRLSTYGIMPNYTEKEIRLMISILVSQGYLALTQSQFPVVRLTSSSGAVLKNEEKVYMAIDTVPESQSGHEEVHKDLFEELRSLRKNLSQEKNVPPYIIFADSSLREMATTLPTTEEAFYTIKGVGQKKYESYGEIFISTIRNYIEENQITPIESMPAIKTSSKKTSKTPSHRESYELYQEGKTLEEIAQMRGFKKDTILTHLAKCQEEGEEIDWSRIVDQEKEALIIKAVDQVGTEYLKPIKEILPEDISYYDIKAVLCKMNLSTV
ncbi:DNA helicase RecQ [Irregularibacter muris]|uniref:DNA helicase RecQ n=1 Tax=Irregularibacter muris TaxID=1796619 RepID=UPI004032CD79